MTKTRLFNFLVTAILGLFTALPVAAQTQPIYKYKWTGTTPEAAINATNDDEKTVFLLNVGKYNNATSKNSPFFAGRGQVWGTEIVISNIPLSLNVERGENGTYRMSTNIKEVGKETQTGYIGFLMDSSGSHHAYFDDRGTSDNIDVTLNEVGNNTRIYTLSHNYTFSDGTATTYYVAALYNPKSTDNVNRTDHVNGFTADELTAAKTEKDGVDQVNNKDDQWMLISLKELKEYFKQVDAAQTDPAIATFLIKDPDFARADMDVSAWKDQTGASLQNDFQRESGDATSHYSPYSTSVNIWTNNCYVGNGFGIESSGDNVGQRDNGGQWTANIKGKGKIQQTVSLDGLREGWYAVRASATTFVDTPNSNGQDSKVKLFAKISKENSNNYQPSSAESYIHTEKAPEEPKYYFTFSQAETKVNDGYHVVSAVLYVGGGDGNNNYLIPTGTNQQLTFGIDALTHIAAEPMPISLNDVTESSN